MSPPTSPPTRSLPPLGVSRLIAIIYPIVALGQAGAELLFYWSTFVIRLCFGSFIVAILVSAFNRVVEAEAEAKQTLKRDASLPPQFVDASQQSSCERAWQFFDFLLTARLYGSYETRLERALETQIALTECEDETGTAKRVQLMLPETELAEVVGARPAALLIRALGARVVDDDDDDDDDDDALL